MRELAREELDEPLQLLRVAAERRGERGGVDVGRLERAHVELEPVAEALDAAEHAHGVALVEARVEQLDVFPDARVYPSARVDELDGFVEFLAAEISHPGLRTACARLLEDAKIRELLRRLPASETHHGYAGGLLEHTVGVATLARETAQLHPRLRTDLLLAAALLHDLGRTRELRPAPGFPQTDEGRLLGHVHLGLRLVEERAEELDAGVRAELLHAIACHHDLRAARTAEAAVLYHANQLDAVAATRPVGD